MKDKTGRKLSGDEVIRKVVNRFYNYYLDFKIYVLEILGWIVRNMEFFRKN